MKTDRIKVQGPQGPQRRTPAGSRGKTHVARGGSHTEFHAGTHGPDFEAQLRSRGIRVTAQRLAVYRALAEDGTHPTAEGVLARVHSHMPMMAPSTVYRTLESFEAEHLIRRVSSTGDIIRFDANLAPHQHLVCRVCGRMMDHFGPALAAAPIPTETVNGFIVEELDIRLVGRCEACRTAASKADSHRVSKSRRRP